MKIPNELTPLAYEVSKQVFESKLTFKKGQQQLLDNGMNPNSAADYINNFRRMVEGEKFTRTNNAYTTEYFLENFYKDYGSTGLANALKALRSHIEYYEGLQKTKMYKIRAIYEKYSVIIGSPDEQEQNEIVRELKQQNKTKIEIVNELKKLKPTDPETITINSTVFKRDNRTIAHIKILRNFKMSNLLHSD